MEEGKGREGACKRRERRKENGKGGRKEVEGKGKAREGAEKGKGKGKTTLTDRLDRFHSGVIAASNFFVAAFHIVVDELAESKT